MTEQPDDAAASSNDAPSEDLHFAGVSSHRLAEVTGRDWEAWVDLLDAAGAEAMDHKSLIAHLDEHHPEVPSAWWRQTLARGYGEAGGHRVVGETADVGYQIGVRRTVALSLDETWQLLTERPELWLGEGASIAFEPGTPYDVPPGDGIPAVTGEVRVVKPGDRMRMSWHPETWDAPATLQIALTAPSPDKTGITVHLEKLADGDARNAMRRHWRGALDRLTAAID